MVEFVIKANINEMFLLRKRTAKTPENEHSDRTDLKQNWFLFCISTLANNKITGPGY